MGPNKTVFPTLRAWRDALGINQRAAATQLGISHSGYAKIELGRRCPRRKLAKAIMKQTGVPLAALMGIE